VQCHTGYKKNRCVKFREKVQGERKKAIAKKKQRKEELREVRSEEEAGSLVVSEEPKDQIKELEKKVTKLSVEIFELRIEKDAYKKQVEDMKEL